VRLGGLGKSKEGIIRVYCEKAQGSFYTAEDIAVLGCHRVKEMQ
jgi:hypothetical protein